MFMSMNTPKDASLKRRIFPVEHLARSPAAIAATMFHLLGINHDTEVSDALDRPLPIAAGKTIYDVMA